MATAKELEALAENFKPSSSGATNSGTTDEVPVTRLSERDSRRFLEILDSDEEPSPALKRAKAKHERLIVKPASS